MLNPNLDDIQLTKEDYERYSRHLILPEVGVDGQKRLKAASVLCIGTGGLGSPINSVPSSGWCWSYWPCRF